MGRWVFAAMAVGLALLQGCGGSERPEPAEDDGTIVIVPASANPTEQGAAAGGVCEPGEVRDCQIVHWEGTWKICNPSHQLCSHDGIWLECGVVATD